MDEKVRFIADAIENQVPFAALCRLYGISRETGYKWWRRYQSEGAEGLCERSRRPHGNSRSVESRLVDEIVAARRKHPSWGPRKLLTRLGETKPSVEWPSASTVGEILKREGLVTARRKRRKAAKKSAPKAPMESCNQTWATDFKGHFPLGNRDRVHPLTITDGHSRYILGIDALLTESVNACKPRFERVFREYGLPENMLSDNGSPFSSRAPGGLSRLSVWFVRLGITPVYIQPGKPQQNGRHERMHRTLKAETARPPAETTAAQQKLFDRFRTTFNEERPHEALGQKPPGRIYKPSLRPFPEQLPEVEYPGHLDVRSVRRSGEMKYRGRFVYVTQALAGERVGLEEIGNDLWLVQFGHIQIGLLGAHDKSVRPLAPLPRVHTDLSAMSSV